MSNIWAVVLGFNGLDDTQRCLTSLAACQGGPPATIYVDNASSGAVADVVESEFHWCQVLRNPANQGYAGGNNRGIEAALAQGADLIVILNNDTVVDPYFFTTMVAAAERHPDVGILGPVVGFCDEPTAVRTDGCVLNHRLTEAFFSRQEVPVAAQGPGDVHLTEIVNGCCMLIRADVFRSIGLFDERFFLVHEESDFCLRAARAGFKLAVLDRMLIWHKGSSSFKRTGQRLQKYFDVRNLAMLLSRQAPFGGRRRGRARSWFAYGRHAYHLFCVEDESGESDAATAVLEGLNDAVFGRVGAYRRRARPLVWPLRQAFVAGRASRNWWSRNATARGQL